MREERGSWYLLTGLVIGIGLGLLYAWIISPIEYVDTAPDTLRADAKDVYRLTIAQAYQSTGDLTRAQVRLNLLGEDDSALALAEQAQRLRASNADPAEVQALANLATALGQVPVVGVASRDSTDTPSPSTPSETATPTLSPTPTPTPALTWTLTPTFALTPTATLTPTVGPTITLTPTPRATNTPEPTRTPLPSITPTATLAPPFVLDNQVQVCNPNLTEPQIQVFINNAAGQGVPGVEVILTWAGGQENFFTGLKPDIDLGYADYVMASGAVYTLQVSGGGQIIPGLSIPECEASGGQRYSGSWRLIFKHP